MPKEKEIPMHLPKADDLFSTQEERDDAKLEKVQLIKLDELDPFPNHPFQVRDDDLMRQTIESVVKNGVLMPAIIREKPDGRFELVSGHRRKFASELAGLDTLPSIVRNLTDDEAILHMVDTNLQREEILPSEKAFAYKMKYEALKRQGGRPTNNYVSVEHNFDGQSTRQIVAEQAGESEGQVRRYIRLTELIPDLLNLVDQKTIGMRPAVELSYLAKKEQVALADVLESEVRTPSHAQAIQMRELSKKEALTTDAISNIMLEDKPNQKEQFRIPKERISQYLKPNMSQQEIQERIVKALELLSRHERKREMER